MAVLKPIIKASLVGLYNSAAEGDGISADDFADSMAGIIKDAILSADVVAGIPVATAGSAVAQTGATTSTGSLI